MATDADIFISFPGKDRKVATTLCSALESRGFTCWISARDINPGENFQVAIVRAIRKAKVMLLVFTANSNQSEEMSKELALASQQKLAVIPLRVEDVTPNDAFAYEFATRQWIDFFADWEYAIDQLAAQIGKIIQADPALMTAGRAAAVAVAAPKVKDQPKAAAKAKPEKAAAKPAIEAAPGPELAPVLDGKQDAFATADESEPASDRKAINPLVIVAGAVAVVLAIGVAVFTMSGHKGQAAASKPKPDAVVSAPAGPPPAPTPSAARAAAPGVSQPAVTAPTDPNAAPGAAPAAPATPTAVKAKAHVVHKTHAPLRASRSDVPY